MTSASTIPIALLELVEQRGPGKTICPSEVACYLGGDTWRNLMPLVRAAGVQLTDEGRIVTLQQGRVVDPRQAKGPIRYGISENQGGPQSC